MSSFGANLAVVVISNNSQQSKEILEKLIKNLNIRKKEEQGELDVVKIQAEQKVVEVCEKGKEKQIQLAGDLTEKEKFSIQVEIDIIDIKVGTAEAIASGVQNLPSPKVLIIYNQ